MPIILIGLILVACAFNQSPRKFEPTWPRYLKGWQKVFGVVAIVLALLIVLNPEFFALGLLGDAAFFDLLVLALSVQMYMYVAQAWRWCVTGLARCVQYLGIPGPAFRYQMTVLMLVIGSAVSALQKFWHRLLS